MTCPDLQAMSYGDVLQAFPSITLPSDRDTLIGVGSFAGAVEALW